MTCACNAQTTALDVSLQRLNVTVEQPSLAKQQATQPGIAEHTAAEAGPKWKSVQPKEAEAKTAKLPAVKLEAERKTALNIAANCSVSTAKPAGEMKAAADLQVHGNVVLQTDVLTVVKLDVPLLADVMHGTALCSSTGQATAGIAASSKSRKRRGPPEEAVLVEEFASDGEARNGRQRSIANARATRSNKPRLESFSMTTRN